MKMSAMLLSFAMMNVAVIGGEAGAVPPSAGREARANIEGSKRLARRYFEEFLNQGKMDVADEIFSDDLILHPPGSTEPLRGLANFKQIIQGFRHAIPDVRFVEEAIVAEGDRVAVQVQFSGTHTGGEWMGVPPKGGRVSANGVDVFRIAGGKIQELWIYFDTRAYLAQLKGESTP